MKISVHSLAQRDYSRALDYYEEESVALAERFEAAIQQGFAKIIASPTAFPYHLKSQIYRRYKTAPFPYPIVYRLKEDEIRIIAIKHEKQRPSFGMNRS